jgi:hypothetical protein
MNHYPAYAFNLNFYFFVTSLLLANFLFVKYVPLQVQTVPFGVFINGFQTLIHSSSSHHQ